MFINYEFLLKGGKITRGTTKRKVIESHKCQPEFPGSDIRCDLERVEAIVTSDDLYRPRIFWSDEVFGVHGNGRLLKEAQLDIALIDIPDCQTWLMRSEPTLDDMVGLTVINSKGRLLFAGIGDLVPTEFEPIDRASKLMPIQGFVFTYWIKEVFRWGTPNPVGSAHTSGADRKVSPAVFPNYRPIGGGGGNYTIYYDGGTPAAN